tara:strand:+ start:1258 stop:1545 length:288 start_codon:yes stop_codon:yes gene_type:complete
METYPVAPGHRGVETSVEAAEAIKPKTASLRNIVLLHLRKYDGLTVHECAHIMNANVPAIQPRFSELKRLGKISDSGHRRVNNASGKKAIVWNEM